MEQESKSSSRTVVRDVLGKVEDGVVSSAERTYVELSGERETHVTPPMGEPMDMESTESSDLAHKTVVLTSKDDEIVATWAEGSEGEEELLEGLKLAAACRTTLLRLHRGLFLHQRRLASKYLRMAAADLRRLRVIDWLRHVA